MWITSSDNVIRAMLYSCRSLLQAQFNRNVQNRMPAYIKKFSYVNNVEKKVSSSCSFHGREILSSQGWEIYNTVHRLHTTVTQTNKKLDKSRVPVLNENDLEESFVRGSGPGGQSVNRTSSACHLKHIPTGFVVKCHETRSLTRNRERARELMIDKLDQHFNGDMSVTAQLKRLQEEKSSKAQQKAKKKIMMKERWKESEGIK